MRQFVSTWISWTSLESVRFCWTTWFDMTSSLTAKRNSSSGLRISTRRRATCTRRASTCSPPRPLSNWGRRSSPSRPSSLWWVGKNDYLLESLCCETLKICFGWIENFWRCVTHLKDWCQPTETNSPASQGFFFWFLFSLFLFSLFYFKDIDKRLQEPKLPGNAEARHW